MTPKIGNILPSNSFADIRLGVHVNPAKTSSAKLLLGKILPIFGVIIISPYFFVWLLTNFIQYHFFCP